jgi:predicted Zn-ribbon and HTH transcriptional regulator
MEREKLEGLLIDFIDGRLTESERKEVKELLAKDDVRVLYEQLKQVTTAMDRSAQVDPSKRLEHSFRQMLQEEIAEQHAPKQKQVFFTPNIIRVAAAVLLVAAGIAIGNYVNEYNTRMKEFAKVQHQRDCIAAENLRLKNDMLAMIGNENSASQRMRGVNVALTYQPVDDEVVNALVKTMNEDKNTNVRLAALDALSKFHQEPNVRKVLIASLAKQDDPVVQIALIQLMVKMKEKGVLKDLNRIIEDSNAIKPVKDEAYSGILKLS